MSSACNYKWDFSAKNNAKVLYEGDDDKGLDRLMNFRIQDFADNSIAQTTDACEKKVAIEFMCTESRILQNFECWERYFLIR